VHALVRAYRIGQRRMHELVFAEVEGTDMEPLVRVGVLEKMSTTMFNYIDWISQQVVEVYEEERERWLENQNSIRALRVREILAAKTPVDVDAESSTIRYPLRWHHLAVVLWYPQAGSDGNELARLQRFLRDIGQAAGVAASPLFVAADAVSGWGWLPFGAAAPEAIKKARQFAATHADSPTMGIGSMAAGVGGFRRSHRRALAARAVAAARDPREPSVIAADDPGVSVAALLGGDIDEAREWVAEVLGDLAADNENDARLRETLHVFLSGGSSYKLAAERLKLHANTVKYRVGRAIARRGRAIGADRLDVELALLLCHWYGGAVTEQRPG
jgi:DNA-binding PucR family transcriptional regulator